MNVGNIGDKVMLKPKYDREWKFSEEFLGKSGTIIEVFSNEFTMDCWQAKVRFDIPLDNGFDMQYVRFCDCMLLKGIVDREIDTNELSALDLF